jgi:hypothetical protein
MTTAPDPPLELLLSDAGARTPVLERGLPATALVSAAPPVEPRGASSLFLDAPDRDPNLLEFQRWGVIAPEGPVGDRLLGAIAPLIRHRHAGQGVAPKIFRAPPGLDVAGAMRWRDRTIRAESLPERERPRYLMILGDLTEVSLELQHILAHGAFVGRLALADEAAHAAYADKIIACEKAVHELPRMLAYTVQDGTSATSAGYRHLVKPCMELAERGRADGTLELAETVTVPHEDDGPDALLAEAAASEAGVLLSLSHGLGAPRAGWASAELQRRTQGALCLGLDSDPLTAETLARRPFLPGGVWLMVACFGAGTPATSAYEPWLAALAARGGDAGAVREVLRSLPRAGEPPFLAALPRAALANPNGPLAVIGHIDLAWTFAFTDDGRSRASRIFDALRALLAGSRVGVGLDVIMHAYRDTNDRLTTGYQVQREALQRGQPDPTDEHQQAHLWMRRNDLRGYVLLGDPAAHLPLARARARVADPTPVLKDSPPAVDERHVATASTTQPVPQDTEPSPPAPVLASFSAPDPRTPPVPRDSHPPRDPARQRERAVLALLRGAESPQAIAAGHAVDLDDLFDWLERYRLGGRGGLDPAADGG